MSTKKPTTVEEYILGCPKIGQDKLKALRSILMSVAPEAKEGLKWGKPVFESTTILFAYAGHKQHLSFIPTGPAIKPFIDELKGYRVQKDSVQLPYHQTLPEELIRRIAEYRKDDVEKKGAKWKY